MSASSSPVLALVLALAAASPDPRRELDAACMGCHVDATAQWLASPHATSFVDGPFQSAHRREPQAFCRACHAPEQDPAIVEATTAAGFGISCVTCHVDDDTVAASTSASHPALRAAIDCDGCHEFDFPDAALREHPLQMQRTVSEHDVSPFAATPCAGCHMPQDDHRMRAETLLESAIDVRVARTNDGVRLELRVLAAGHAVPTGDLFRRLEVGAMIVDPRAPQGPALRYLSRRFDDGVQSNAIAVLMETADDRVPADGTARIVELALPDADARPIVWWVEHQRVAFPRGGEALDGRTPMAGGLLIAGDES
ncbi:MAG TPA: multiheme c-type cytochrome [Nannocystaceae bacterium]|nr:multiheme c-type cytochrome [Nannocystaceae bacterium]